jgi:nickel-dependent lactate racemase
MQTRNGRQGKGVPGVIYFRRSEVVSGIAPAELRACLRTALDAVGARKRVLVVPPDYTRRHSFAGELTRFAYEYYRDRLTDVLPALGTHTPMTGRQTADMFAGVPAGLFRVHDWRREVRTLGEVPADFVAQASGGAVDYRWPAQVATLVAEGRHDLILSIGQVVPHEVAGMAGYNKNIFVGTGGSEGINKSHFIGAAFGMERLMGRADNAVRRVLNYASDHFASHLPVVYALTVVARGADGRPAVKGLFVGDDIECFLLAAGLSLQMNFQMLDAPVARVVVYLDPAEFKSTWLGNKSIYRTRMAIADGGDLIVLAPGVREFGEDPEIDRLIRAHGYVGTPRVLDAVKRDPALRENLGAAAHLIHGSSEGRFAVTYCPGRLTREEIEGVNFRYGDLSEMMRRYDPAVLRDGWNEDVDGSKFFYISNPALGLWASRERFSGGA